MNPPEWTYLRVFVLWELVALIGSMLVVVVHRLLSGTINIKGLLQDKLTGATCPARVQLLMLTGSAALYYVALVVQQLKVLDGQRSLPDLPPQLLYALGASHTVFLGVKAASATQNKTKDTSNGPNSVK